jgi:hypothetical protein
MAVEQSSFIKNLQMLRNRGLSHTWYPRGGGKLSRETRPRCPDARTGAKRQQVYVLATVPERHHEQSCAADIYRSQDHGPGDRARNQPVLLRPGRELITAGFGCMRSAELAHEALDRPHRQTVNVRSSDQLMAFLRRPLRNAGTPEVLVGEVTKLGQQNYWKPIFLIQSM